MSYSNTIELHPVSYPLRQLTLQGWRSGPADGPLCLCLHGWLDNANSFIPLAKNLPHLQLIAIDLPGHGQSEHRSLDAHYHFFDWVDDMVQLLQLISNQPVHLIGHSMGGMIATALAASFPELVNSLVLIDSIGFVTAPESNTTEQLRKAVLSRQKRLDKRKPQYPDVASAAAARQAQSDFDFATALLLAERGTVQHSNPGNPSNPSEKVTWSADLRLREVSAYRLSDAQALQLISSVQAPTFAIVAKQGIELMQQNRQRWQSHYRYLQLVELDAGHHLHMTHSNDVALQMMTFLASLKTKC
ncbi:MAG: alpha/beta hydrolase [Gammaproteobacteria bacterium]|nr:alpha/beta hydrolase [Gammaproteobacteria bacterium]